MQIGIHENGQLWQWTEQDCLGEIVGCRNLLLDEPTAVIAREALAAHPIMDLWFDRIKGPDEDERYSAKVRIQTLKMS